MEGWAIQVREHGHNRRESLLNAAQQETPMLTVDDVEAGPDSVEINPQVYVALAELLEGEALDIVQNTARGAGLEAWRKLVRNFDPQTVGRKRTLLSRNINPGTVKVHELSRPIEQWEERVRSCHPRYTGVRTTGRPRVARHQRHKWQSQDAMTHHPDSPTQMSSDKHGCGAGYHQQR